MAEETKLPSPTYKKLLFRSYISSLQRYMKNTAATHFSTQNTLMATWSAENAIKAYLHSLKMGKRDNELDVAEFISAMAAGNNAQLMVIASAGIAESTTLSLVAAAHHTGGEVVCILPSKSNFIPSKKALGPYADSVKFVVGDAKTLLAKNYEEADFVLIDCDLDGVFMATEEYYAKNGKELLVVGYNAFHKGSSAWSSDSRTRFLPIGDGLLVTRLIGSTTGKGGGGGGFRSRCGHGRRSKWVTKVDKYTGEEHVYRITSSSPKQEIIEA